MSGQNRGTPLIRLYFAAISSSNVKMVANRHRHAVYCNKHWLLKNVNIDDL